MIPKKEEILQWIMETNSKKKPGSTGGGGGIDEEKLDEIVCDIIVKYLDLGSEEKGSGN